MNNLRNQRTPKPNRSAFNNIKIYSERVEIIVQKNGQRKFAVFYDNNHYILIV